MKALVKKIEDLEKDIEYVKCHFTDMQGNILFNEDFKLSEIAEIMGCSVGTIKNHLFRCTQKMRYALSFYVE